MGTAGARQRFKLLDWHHHNLKQENLFLKKRYDTFPRTHRTVESPPGFYGIQSFLVSLLPKGAGRPPQPRWIHQRMTASSQDARGCALVEHSITQISSNAALPLEASCISPDTSWEHISLQENAGEPPVVHEGNALHLCCHVWQTWPAFIILLHVAPGAAQVSKALLICGVELSEAVGNGQCCCAACKILEYYLVTHDRKNQPGRCGSPAALVYKVCVLACHQHPVKEQPQYQPCCETIHTYFGNEKIALISMAIYRSVHHGSKQKGWLAYCHCEAHKIWLQIPQTWELNYYHKTGLFLCAFGDWSSTACASHSFSCCKASRRKSMRWVTTCGHTVLWWCKGKHSSAG